MENWGVTFASFQAALTSCIATSFSYPTPITVLAGGSQFLYLLDAHMRRHIGIVKFRAGVVHVSMLYAVKELEMSTVVCCLADGLVAAFDVTHIVQQSSFEEGSGKSIAAISPSIDDLFESLFGDLPRNFAKCSGKKTTSTLDGTEVSEGIAVCPLSDWTLIAANVTNDCLVMCRKSRRTGEISFVLLRSSKSIVIPAGSRNTIVPSFVSAFQILTFALVIGRNFCNKPSPTKANVVHIKPVFSLVQSAEHPWNCCNSITSELFLSLFGPEFDLCNAPVLLIGSQNGNIYFTNFKCSISGEREDSIVVPLYSLEQPVVGIHYACFPQKKLPTDNDPMAILWDVEEEREQRTENSTPNAIIFVGQRGKISIWHSNPGESKSFPSIVEFQVPTPLMSSILVPKSCLLFSTLHGLYRICLRQECAKCVEEKFPSLTSAPISIRIPHVSFKFPEKIVDTSCMSYILKTRTSDSYYCTTESQDDPLQCSYTSMDGNIVTLQFGTHNDRQTTSSAAVVGQEIKQCLQSIQIVGDKINQTKKKIVLLKTVLTDLKGVLDMLCAVGGACTGNNVLQSSVPFACSFLSVHEDVGVRVKKLYVDVRLTYTRPQTETRQLHDALGTGWSFFITSSSNSSGSGSSSSSRSVSMAGMIPGDSVCLRVEVEEPGSLEGRPLIGSILAFIHYTPHYLCDLVFENTSTFVCKTFKGISLFFYSKTFTILDFLQPSRPMLHGSSKETLSSVQRIGIEQILSHKTSLSSSLSLLRPSSALLFSINLPIWPDSVICTILASSSSTREELIKLDERSLCTKLICTLVPTASAEDLGNTRSCQTKMLFKLSDSLGVSFEVRSAEIVAALNEEERCSEPLQLSIQSSSKSCLVQVVSALHMIMANDMTVGPEKVQGRTLPHTHTQMQLSKRLADTECLRTEVRNLKEELSAASQAVKRNCMNSDGYSKKLHSIKSQMFSAFCKLRLN